MSSPFFITGANAKVVLNGRTLAYCTDVSYSIQVLHQTPKVLGMYEGSSVEPLGYNVSGSFSVIRYVRHARSSVDNLPSGDPSESGNGVGNWGSAWESGTAGGAALGALGLGNEGRANEALDPSRFDNGTTFDIRIYQKMSDANIGVANIRNARITQADFALSKRSLAMQRFTFTALYVDEDAFVADFSGRGQHF